MNKLNGMHSVPRIGEIKSGRMRWTAQAVCMENKQDIKQCTFKPQENTQL